MLSPQVLSVTHMPSPQAQSSTHMASLVVPSWSLSVSRSAHQLVAEAQVVSHRALSALVGVEASPDHFPVVLLPP